MKIIAQLSWPVPPESWLQDNQFGWTHALVPFHENGHEVIFLGQTQGQKDGTEKPYSEMEKHGCRVVMIPEQAQFAYLRDQSPDLIFFNDYPEVYWSWAEELKKRSRLVMRMHGDWRMFVRFLGTLKLADMVIAPMTNDPHYLKVLGLDCPVKHIPFGVQIEDLVAARKPWDDRKIDFGCPATTPLKGLNFMQALFPRLEALGYRCEHIAWMGRKQMVEAMADTRVFFCPSAHEGWSRVCTEAAVSGAHLVVCAESANMVEQAYYLGGRAISTGLVSDVMNLLWNHRRPITEVVEDLIRMHGKKPATHIADYQFSIERENELLTTALQEALP